MDMGFEEVIISITYRKLDGTKTDIPLILVQLAKTVANKHLDYEEMNKTGAHAYQSWTTEAKDYHTSMSCQNVEPNTGL